MYRGDTKDYRYCGYAEALAKGSSLACEGISTVLGQSAAISWKEISQQYRKYLFVHRRRDPGKSGLCGIALLQAQAQAGLPAAALGHAHNRPGRC